MTELLKLHRESVRQAFVASGASGQDDVLPQVRSDVDIAFQNCFVNELMNALDFTALLDDFWVEEGLRSLEPRSVDEDLLAIR